MSNSGGGAGARRMLLAVVTVVAMIWSASVVAENVLVALGDLGNLRAKAHV